MKNRVDWGTKGGGRHCGAKDQEELRVKRQMDRKIGKRDRSGETGDRRASSHFPIAAEIFSEGWKKA